ncbi:MAG: anhydro-N-acetylmuramic acid kinase, partial [Cohaesibacteraceae bacterium]|nr:anhydro-N-acetylmuramic acid kinase [Cohaesibacteraceae bacterium]
MQLAIGVISGTSMDGIDVAAIRTNGTNDIQRIAGTTFAYQPGLRDRIAALLQDHRQHKMFQRHNRWWYCMRYSLGYLRIRPSPCSCHCSTLAQDSPRDRRSLSVRQSRRQQQRCNSQYSQGNKRHQHCKSLRHIVRPLLEGSRTPGHGPAV